jgi:hypothetical protein
MLRKKGLLDLGKRHSLVPIEAVRRVAGGFVRIDLSKEQGTRGAELDPNIRLHPDLRSKIY